MNTKVKRVKFYHLTTGTGTVWYYCATGQWSPNKDRARNFTSAEADDYMKFIRKTDKGPVVKTFAKLLPQPKNFIHA